MSAVPAGFAVFDIRSPFIHKIGPLYRRVDGDIEVFGMLIGEEHCNFLKIAHGGLLATFADIIVSRSAVVAKGEPCHALTVSLTTDFIGSAPLGSWIQGRANVSKAGKSLAFSSCEVRIGDTIVLRASGVMKYVQARS